MLISSVGWPSPLQNVRECVRAGLWRVLSALRAAPMRNSRMCESEIESPCELYVLEAAWVHMTELFVEGDTAAGVAEIKHYIAKLRLRDSQVAATATSGGGGGVGGGDVALWDRNAEEGDNIHIESMLQLHLAELAVRGAAVQHS